MPSHCIENFSLYLPLNVDVTGSGKECGHTKLIDSEIARRIELKLGQGHAGDHTCKGIFLSINVDRGQVGGPQVPLLGHGDDKVTQNWA